MVLTGSSARKLRRQGVRLLGGRTAQRFLHPYMAAELGSHFELETALRQGSMLPLLWAADNPQAILESCNALYLHEEVQMEGLVRNIGNFAKFLQAMSFSQAAVLNLVNVSREVQGSRKTVEGYLDVMEDLLLGFRLEVFAKCAKRELATHPKFYFFDKGAFRASRPVCPLDSVSEVDGAALEGLVAQRLRAWCGYSQKNELYHWQTRSRSEVDFIVYEEGGPICHRQPSSRLIRSGLNV